MFSRYHNLDDVRGLVIAAFWMSEVSWKLSGHAIRIATELGVHLSFYRALNGDREHFLRARLWYMLYVCDHHFSIAYGRPPMISESLQIREHELFLQVPLADAIDQRILAQVSLMQILTRVNDRFAEHRLLDQDSSGAIIGDQDFDDMRNFNLEIDQWRVKWVARQAVNQFIGEFPAKGIVMYSYMAKLQLNCLAVRGINIAHGRLSTERRDFANMAISAAASILTFVLEEDVIRRALVGSPLYYHTMIAFASAFLIKVTTKWSGVLGLNITASYVNELLERMIVLLRSSVTSDRHLLHHIAAGLQKMLDKSRYISTSGLSELRAGSELRRRAGRTSSTSLDPTAYVQPVQTNSAPDLTDFSSSSNTAPDGLEACVSSAGQDTLAADQTILNDGWLYEAFASDSANDVYDLLTSQFPS